MNYSVVIPPNETSYRCKNNKIMQACQDKEYVFVSQQRYTAMLDSLTPRETEVLYWVSRGFNNAEIAEKMIVSPRTVKNHLNHIFKKLETADRTKAAVMAWEEGLACLPEDFFALK